MKRHMGYMGNASDLVKCEPLANPVILSSGGPVLDVICVEGDHAICQWDDNQGRKQTHSFKCVMLRSVVPFVPEETA